ncbi:SDR family NAD(P)-dependent oxidoreductase [Flavobacterium sp. NG2]|uniref:SDR family NAD(P)-dependent oxidoreductase n=1 Tax=Flavobacterium sp. NG2 TaxID=3097547 RepID=UPI002A81FB84|nr:SDR family NAD(P)-dependent oxidoreductase [Flavobacterium sp. NG2]WPR72994.1 SDR family NAD(P)-dependent oxidoreductase [Flavobacterium sp. NG2]
MKTVLITGACGGIGKATALYFAKNGWNVIATMLCLESGKELSNIKGIACYELDVTSTESVVNCKKQILTEYQTVDLVINNAGVGYRSFVELAEDSQIDAIVDVNWLGVVKVCRAFIPVFRKQNKGLFINITSIAGLVNLPLGSFYHSTKHAVESFSECMAYELRDFNISVATVQFGNTPSNFQKNVVKSEESSISSYNELMEKIDAVLAKKTKKNTDLKQSIVEQLFEIAQNPPQDFKRYTIGFDANFLNIIRKRLGYRLFARLIRKSVF